MAFNAVDNLPVQGAWMVVWPFWGGPLDPVLWEYLLPCWDEVAAVVKCSATDNNVVG